MKRKYQVNVINLQFALRKSTEMAASRMRTDEGGVGGIIVNVASLLGQCHWLTVLSSMDLPRHLVPIKK